MGVGWVALLMWSCIDCWHTHTGLKNVTDVGLEAFSAALGSSTSITTVELCGKYKCLVCSYEWTRVLLCMQVVGNVVSLAVSLNGW